MRRQVHYFQQFMQDQEGLTVVEYVVAAALLVGALVVFFTGYEVTLSGKINQTVSSLPEGN
ncbi:Flp family type IVb pilin [Vibrio gallicus]|uniref:Flp family type IVb pilin n=1 Tax=Vibrio gallicus TaxID=190897 RepID=UPI0021C3A9EB|nr:Flp family type IVb pilin [Vibrio gallicus]